MMKYDLSTAATRLLLPGNATTYVETPRANLAIGLSKRTETSEGLWGFRYGNGTTLPYVNQLFSNLYEVEPEKRYEVAFKKAMIWADEIEANLIEEVRKIVSNRSKVEDAR